MLHPIHKHSPYSSLTACLTPVLVAFASTALVSAAPVSGAQIQSLVYPAGWPDGAQGQVLDIDALRMTTSLEQEFLYFIDDTLYLAANAGRYQDWRVVDTKVEAADVLPAGGGTDKVVAFAAGEMVTIAYDGNQSNPMVVTSLVGSLPTWDDIDQLWVQERSGVQRVYGYDLSEGKLRRADHNNGVWTTLTDLTVGSQLRDVQFVELDASSTGEELVLLSRYELEILSDSGSLIEEFKARPADAIGVMRNSQANPDDLLAWCFDDGSEYKLKVWNETVESLAFSLGSDDCTAIHARQTSDYGEHLLLTRGGQGDVDLVRILPGTGSTDVVLARHQSGDTLDTHSDPGNRPVQCSAVGDLDMDGELELVVATDGSGGLQLGYVMTRDVRKLTVGKYSGSGPVYTDLGSNHYRLESSLDLGPQMPSQVVLLELWAVKDPSATNPTMDLVLSQQYTVPTSANTAQLCGQL